MCVNYLRFFVDKAIWAGPLCLVLCFLTLITDSSSLKTTLEYISRVILLKAPGLDLLSNIRLVSISPVLNKFVLVTLKLLLACLRVVIAEIEIFDQKYLFQKTLEGNHVRLIIFQNQVSGSLCKVRYTTLGAIPLPFQDFDFWIIHFWTQQWNQ